MREDLHVFVTNNKEMATHPEQRHWSIGTVRRLSPRVNRCSPIHLSHSLITIIIFTAITATHRGTPSRSMRHYFHPRGLGSVETQALPAHV